MDTRRPRRVLVSSALTKASEQLLALEWFHLSKLEPVEFGGPPRERLMGRIYVAPK